MQLITHNALIVSIDEHDEITGGSVTVNGKTYDNIVPVKYEGELPGDLAPEKYIIAGSEIVPNPSYEGSDIVTRLNDIEQILIDLLDTM